MIIHNVNQQTVKKEFKLYGGAIKCVNKEFFVQFKSFGGDTEDLSAANVLHCCCLTRAPLVTTPGWHEGRSITFILKIKNSQFSQERVQCNQGLKRQRPRHAHPSSQTKVTRNFFVPSELSRWLHFYLYFLLWNIFFISPKMIFFFFRNNTSHGHLPPATKVKPSHFV